MAGRERWIVAAVGAGTAALLIVAVLALVSSGPKLAAGCINVTISSSLGGQQISGCGATARSMCKLVNTPGGYTGAAGTALAEQCRRQGIPVD
jgi:hypothetical protein